MDENVNVDVTGSDTIMGDFVIEKAKDVKGTLGKLMTYFAKQRIKFIIVLCSVLISSALTIFAPIFLGRAINNLFDAVKASMTEGQAFQMNFGFISQMVFILLALYIASAAF